MTTPTPDPTRQVDGVLERSLRDLDIPPRPLILDRIRDEMHRPEPDPGRIARLIGRDVGLAAGLIKTANSPYFGYTLRARSVAEALLMLGLDTASRAIAALSLRRAFPDGARYERFWHNSAQIAALSGWLAQRCSGLGVPADNAYTYGLFRDCGIVILLRRYADYPRVLAAANADPEGSFTGHERAALPTEHALVGSLLAQDWWLPDALALAIRHHHARPLLEHPDAGLPTPSASLVALAQTAERLVQLATGGACTAEWAKLGPACLARLGLAEEGMEALAGEAAALLGDID
ncbi:HDOD domain-containing protein [Zoogloea sp.]|uniref:HDOD domain-containing protein n=1 Tax=Zoogloea sp. TaxID=49181 RepID=UPI002614A9AF|nr:HDOD domain-containing protein [uncultured Zoogloea sp.]